MNKLRRREFLVGGASLAATAIPLTAAADVETPPPGPPRVRRYNRLGRTGLEISDISFGGSRLRGDVQLVRRALDRGVNYFDTAESYTDGASEETIGRALGAERKRVFLTSKYAAGPHETADDVMAALDRSLARLRTDYVDVYFNHAVNAVERIANPEWARFVEKAKAAGKIRFAGMSGHGGRLVECVDYALDHDLVDVLLLAFNFGQDPAFFQRFTRSFDFVAVQPDLPRVLKKARGRDVGVVAMKTLRGARLNDLRAYETEGVTFSQAALRWTLSSGLADALIITMKTPSMIDEYLGASGAGATGPAALRLLDRYEDLVAVTQCRFGCSACLDACPHGVEIPEVLRTLMYTRDYADPALGRGDYAKLGVGDASACLGCSVATCAGACPYGLPIPVLTRETHARNG